VINDALSLLPSTLTFPQTTLVNTTLRSLLEMRFLLSLSAVALSFFLAHVAANPHGSPNARRHDSIARRAPGNASTHLQKRDDNSRWTYYDVGLGACGVTNVASDFIVALNTPEFGSGYPGPNCFKQISMSYNGQSTIAQIMDECPGCPEGGLDLSRGLFDFFAPESEGVIYGTWNYVDDSDQPSPTTTTSTTPAWTPPTTTQQTPSSTPTPTPTPTSTSTWSSSSSTYSSWSQSSSSPPPSSSSSSSNSINSSSEPASNLAVPTPATISDSTPHNLLTLNEDVIALGALVVAGGMA